MASVLSKADVCWIEAWLEYLSFAYRMLGVKLRLDFDVLKAHLTAFKKTEGMSKCMHF